MKNFRLVMKTPDGLFLDKQVEYVVLPSSEGEYGVLYGHMPVVLWLNTGLCEYTENGKLNRVYIMEGVANVERESVVILSEFIEEEDKLEQSLNAREEYHKAEKKRRKESYYEYKQSSVELAKAMRNLANKRNNIN